MSEINIPFSTGASGALNIAASGEPTGNLPAQRVKAPTKSAGVPREERGGTFVAALATALGSFTDSEAVLAATESRGFYDAGLLQQWRILAEVAVELAGPAAISALESSLDERVRGLGPAAVRLLYLSDLHMAAACLRRQSALPGTSVQEGAQMVLKALLIEHGLETALPHVLDWATDPLPEVRRCLIEALRPRGVWTGHLTALRRDPEPLVPVLELLLDDPSLYVRKAVANCLNDVGKDNPEVLVRWVARWQGGGAEREWALARGLRGLVKAGHPEALRLLGLAEATSLSGHWRSDFPQQVVINQELPVEVEVTNSGDQPARVLVQGVLTGPGRGRAPRVRRYRIGAASVPAGGTATISGRLHFVDFNSQPKLPGTYELAVEMNGAQIECRRFTYA